MNCWKIKKLQPQNFRNLGNQVFDFVPGINCIFGQNGNGKTNLLEAVYLLTNKKSFRKNTAFPQMINIEGGSPEIIIQSAFEDEDKKELLAYSLRLHDDYEERFLNNVPEKSKTPTSSVFINPFDSYSFHTSSTFRRHWMDSHLSLMDSDYRKTLGKFQKSMRFRNSVLGIGGKTASNQLKAIDEQVAEYSAIITDKRHQFIQGLNEQITSTFKAVFAEEHFLKLDLDSVFTHWDAKKDF